ncbi:MAG TPA: endolytic transglycosylase MltG [Polyangiaceae bacterium]|nr:endolytic transglycosylase MltG [Polyangiaceae bacterium]
MAAKRRRKKRSAGESASPSGSSRGGIGWRWVVFAGLAPLLLAAALAGILWSWAGQTTSSPQIAFLELPAGLSRLEMSTTLRQRGVLDKPLLFAGYWFIFHPRTQIEPGAHSLPGSLSMSDLLTVLARKTTRPQVKITLPEGQNSFQMAAILAAHAVCSERALLELAHNEAFARSVGVQAASLEGYLYPDTYEFFVNSTPGAVINRLTAAALQHYGHLLDAQESQFQDLEQRYGFHLQQVVTLASMVEREAADPSEDPIVASVFYNRLSDESFKPRQMLQSDPTAGYGCLRQPDLQSCQGYSGKITPQLLRDDQNPYNTYRHPGLPPGPVGNPGQAALLAVLNPASTPYLFFVANGHGKHAFSRTLAEHQMAIAGGQ